jgi:hypothetical protein
MSQDIDLQAQQEGESDKAYLAYTTYRDLGERRTEQGAYEAYTRKVSNRERNPSEKIGKASPAFRRWVSEFDWDKRIKDWDGRKAQRIQSAQLDADRQGYIQRIEDSRALLERTATMGMKSAELSLAIGFAQLQKLAKESTKASLGKADLDRLVAITRNNKDSIDTLAAAKTEIYDALGLVNNFQTLEQLAQSSNS